MRTTDALVCFIYDKGTYCRGRKGVRYLALNLASHSEFFLESFIQSRVLKIAALERCALWQLLFNSIQFNHSTLYVLFQLPNLLKAQ
jgi:hypothetical protein